MTTTACAAALDITQPAWNQWELGVREPKLDMLIRVATLMDCSIDSLMMPGGERTTEKPSAPSRLRASKAAPGEHPDCAKCPYKKKLEEVEAFFAAARKKKRKS